MTARQREEADRELKRQVLADREALRQEQLRRAAEALRAQQDQARAEQLRAQQASLLCP